MIHLENGGGDHDPNHIFDTQGRRPNPRLFQELRCL